MLRRLVDTRDKRLLFAAGALVFLAIGAVQAMYGPAFPTFLERYHVGVGEVGAVVSAHFLGSFGTLAATGFLLVRLGYRRLLVLGSGGLALGAFGVAFSPSWTVTLVAAFFGGLGFGLVDATTNLLFARAFGGRAGAALNLLNAAFGLGAVLGPLLVGLLAPHATLAYLAVSALCLAAVVLGSLAPMPEPLSVPLGAPRLPFGPLAGFMAFFFLYVSCEVGVASWEPTYLAPVLGTAVAAFLTSVYWGALTLGRFVAAEVSARMRSADLVLGSLLLALTAAWLAVLVPVAAVAYALVGLTFAPVFPTALAWLQEVFPQRAERIVPIVIAGSSLGPVATAPAIGVAVAWSGTRMVPLALGLLVLMLVAVATLQWRGTRASTALPRDGAGLG